MNKNNRKAAALTAIVAMASGVVVATTEHQVVMEALKVCFRKAELHPDLQIPIVKKGRLIEVLRGYAQKRGTNFATGKAGWDGQIGRWPNSGAFPEYRVTRMGIARVTDIAKILVDRPTKQYVTRELTCLSQENSKQQKQTPKVTKKQQPATVNRRRQNQIQVRAS